MREWSAWMFGDESKRRIVEKTPVAGGIIEVSTVFLGLNHRHFGDGPPLLFETMVFGLTMEDGDMQWRYSTWDDAEAGHKATVRKVKRILIEVKSK